MKIIHFRLTSVGWSGSDHRDQPIEVKRNLRKGGTTQKIIQSPASLWRHSGPELAWSPQLNIFSTSSSNFPGGGIYPSSFPPPQAPKSRWLSLSWSPSCHLKLHPGHHFFIIFPTHHLISILNPFRLTWIQTRSKINQKTIPRAIWETSNLFIDLCLNFNGFQVRGNLILELPIRTGSENLKFRLSAFKLICYELLVPILYMFRGHFSVEIDPKSCFRLHQEMI